MINEDNYIRERDIFKITKFKEAEKKLEKYNFKKIGSGAFAKVFAHPELNYVLKIFDRDNCYLKYAQLSIINRNVSFLFPRIKAPILDLGENVYAVKMEKLMPNRPDYYSPEAHIEEIVYAIKNRGLRYFLRNRLHFNFKTEDKAKEFLKRTNIVDWIKLVKRTLPPYGFLDLHSENIMIRPNGQLVVTDPVAS